MNKKKTINLTPANQSKILPISTEGLQYISYKHSVFSTELFDTAYTMKIAIYPTGKIRVQERVGHGKISDQRQYEAAPEAVARLFEDVVECINNKYPYEVLIPDDSAGKLTLYYPDRNIKVDRGARDAISNVHLGDIVLRFFEENGIGWNISEEGWQQYLEMVGKRRID